MEHLKWKNNLTAEFTKCAKIMLYLVHAGMIFGVVMDMGPRQKAIMKIYLWQSEKNNNVLGKKSISCEMI